MPGTPDGYRFDEKPHEYETRTAAERASDLLAEAEEHVDASEFVSAARKIDLAAIAYCDARFHLHGPEDPSFDEVEKIRQAGLELAEVDGSDEARAIFRGDSKPGEDCVGTPEVRIRPRPSGDGSRRRPIPASSV